MIGKMISRASRWGESATSGQEKAPPVLTQCFQPQLGGPTQGGVLGGPGGLPVVCHPPPPVGRAVM